MSHVRRVVAVILLALTGWLMAFGGVAAVTSPASATSTPSDGGPVYVCC
jgi:hypothetical protein